MTTQLKAKLRVCASCEWIFERGDNKEEGMEGCCPKCCFGSYGARHVYGDKCYRYKRTQEPWKQKRLDTYEFKLQQEIDEWNESKKPFPCFGTKGHLFLVEDIRSGE